ncbi:unnamed protein product [Rotaria socialis]|nr:unnamed protein product [Rotaria socialis]
MIHSYILQEKTKDDDTKILAVKYPCNWVSDLGIHLDTQVVDIMTSLNFRDVYYCPGNHELWTRSGSTTTSSFKENRNNSKIITFSHVLTSKKLMKAYIDEMSLRRQKWLDSRKVAGTELLNEQLKLIKPQVHIFAHSQNGIGYWSWYSIYK